MSSRAINLVLALAIGVASCFWLCASLGNGMLWQDEAQTALLGRTTLRCGYPYAFDGANSISQEHGDDYGPHGAWKWHMWLPFYILAGFFKVFGESTAVARLPFALFGVATVVLSYFTALKLWNDIKSAVAGSVLLLVCVPFELLVRQCRYYSPAMFFSLLMMDAYIRICHGSRRAWILLAIAGALLFNCHFIYCATALAAIFVHAAIWHRGQWRSIALAGGAAGLLCLAPVLWLATLNYKNYHSVIDLHFFIFQLKTYFVLVFVQVLPYPVLLIPIVVCIRLVIRPWTSGRRALFQLAWLEPWAFPVLFGLFTILAIAPFTPWPFFRYIGPLIAPLMILLGRWLVVSFQTHVLLGISLLVFLSLWWPDSNYLFELQHHFAGPTEAIVQLLLARGKPGDRVATEYDDLALKFYTPFRVYGGLTGEQPESARGARWLIPRRNQVSPNEKPMRQFIYDQISTNPHYHPITLSASDTPFENREEPKEHLFQTLKGLPPVIVYELRQD